MAVPLTVAASWWRPAPSRMAGSFAGVPWARGRAPGGAKSAYPLFGTTPYEAACGPLLAPSLAKHLNASAEHSGQEKPAVQRGGGSALTF